MLLMLLERLLVASSAVGTRWCGVLLLLLALQSTVVSGAIIPASTPPTLISLTTPAARPWGREVSVFNDQ